MSGPHEHLNSEEDVEAILRLAVRNQGSGTEDLRSRLQMAAQELGVTEEELKAAEEAYRKEKLFGEQEANRVQTEAELWKKWRKIQIHNYYSHVFTYVGVNAGLMGLNFLTSGKLSWVWFVIAGWGIGILTHLAKVLASYSSDNHAEFQKWARKQNKSAEQKYKSEKKYSSKELEDRIEDLVEDGKWGEAISTVVELTGWELKKAEKYVKKIADD